MLLYPAGDVYTISLDQLLSKKFPVIFYFPWLLLLTFIFPDFYTVNSVVHMLVFWSQVCGWFFCRCFVCLGWVWIRQFCVRVHARPIAEKCPPIQGGVYKTRGCYHGGGLWHFRSLSERTPLDYFLFQLTTCFALWEIWEYGNMERGKTDGTFEPVRIKGGIIVNS